MKAFICTVCATQFAPTEIAPSVCPICRDERQYVPATGQTWTTHEALASRHANQFRQHEPGVIGIGSVPQFAIGQRALLIRTPAGNFLWDCIALIDAATVEMIKGIGGLKGIAISHPHYYASMLEWSRAFGGVPIHLHAADRQWVMYPDAAIQFWDGDTTEIAPGLTLIRTGGHFAGATVAHWALGGQGKGALLAGDVVFVIPDRGFVSFMRSYPNLIPLSGPAVRRIGEALEPFLFEAIYGPFFDRNIANGGKDIVRRSVERYIRAVTGDGSAELE